MAKLKITLKKSTNNRLTKHRRTLEALGLKKIGQSVEHEDTPSLRGQLRQVDYLVEVESL